MLLSAVDSVSVIGPDKVKTLTLELGNNILTLSCKNEDQEDSQNEIEVIYDNPTPLKITFNLNYVRDMLINNNFDTLQLAFFDASRSVLITTPNNSNFKAVIMPLRV